MKTAQEWIEHLRATNCNSVDWLSAIQSDAKREGLLEAAGICRNVSANEPVGGARHLMSLNLSEAIESAANKLKP